MPIEEQFCRDNQISEEIYTANRFQGYNGHAGIQENYWILRNDVAILKVTLGGI